MTEEQKNYLDNKIEEYTDIIEKKDRYASRIIYLIGLCGVAALLDFNDLDTSDVTLDTFVNIGYGAVNTAMSVYFLKSLIDTISKKNMLEGIVEKIMITQKLDELDEKHNMKL